MKRDIERLITKYKRYVEKVETNLKIFPEQEIPLLARKNIYLDIILDLRNVLDLHKED